MNLWLALKVQESPEDKVLTFLCLTRGKKKKITVREEDRQENGGGIKENSNSGLWTSWRN